MTELFDKYVERIQNKDRVEFECRKGLWSVSGYEDQESRLRREAEHYFVQYFNDGEYDA